MSNDDNDLIGAIERLIDAKRRPRSVESSDNPSLNQALLRGAAQPIDVARAALGAALAAMGMGPRAGAAAADLDHTHDRCGKCGSHDLLRIPNTPGDHSHIVSGDRFLRNVAVDKYVCTDCGHVEEWVNNKEDLQRLKEEWVREQAGRSPARRPDPIAQRG
jgi:hypothetical protein